MSDQQLQEMRETFEESILRPLVIQYATETGIPLDCESVTFAWPEYPQIDPVKDDRP